MPQYSKKLLHFQSKILSTFGLNLLFYEKFQMNKPAEEAFQI